MSTYLAFSWSHGLERKMALHLNERAFLVWLAFPKRYTHYVTMPVRYNICIYTSLVIVSWLKYCWYGVKLYPFSQPNNYSINQYSSLYQLDTFERDDEQYSINQHHIISKESSVCFIGPCLNYRWIEYSTKYVCFLTWFEHVLLHDEKGGRIKQRFSRTLAY